MNRDHITDLDISSKAEGTYGGVIGGVVGVMEGRREGGKESVHHMC